MPSPGAGGVQTSLVGRVQSMMATARSALRRKPGAPVESPGDKNNPADLSQFADVSSPVAASLRRATHCRRSNPRSCASSTTRSAKITSIPPDR